MGTTETERLEIDRMVDMVWSRALDKITKEGVSGSLRPVLGDDIELFVPQATTAALLNANPAFARLHYNAAYVSAKRNAFFIIRRLGMPPDFFWKFDYWSSERALETLRKVMERVFAALMSQQKEGLLELVSVDVESGRFEASFGSCAECSGFSAPRPICVFHSGIFAGILAAMLDRDLDAYEFECDAAGGSACRFRIGSRDDRQIAHPLEEALDNLAVTLDIQQRARDTLEQVPTRDMGNLVDVGYYQLLLSSSYLTNLPLLERACFATGRETGVSLASLVAGRFPGEPLHAIGQLYRELRHMDVQLSDQGGEIEVQVEEAPEASGPLANASLVPFLVGELEGLLSELTDRAIAFQSSRVESGKLFLRFAPQV